MNRVKRREGRRRGFSLIELLVVISIVALLVGILLPALARARDAARASACLSNVKQVALALPVHAGDYQGHHPLAGGAIGWGELESNVSYPQLPSWMEQLYSYLQTQDVYQCPSFPPEEDDVYHYFLGTRAAYVAAGDRAPLREDRVRYTSAHVVMGDFNWRNFILSPGGLVDADKDDYTQPCIEWNYLTSANHWRPHHNGAMNLAFLDGHAGSFTQFEPMAMTYRYDTMSAW